jgi:PadR family transcriptional regulator, regulatory protein AphA
MARVNTSRYALLGLLSLGPRSGYDLKKLIDRSIAHFWNESFGQIYPILRGLEADGLARRRSERQHGKPDRQVYTLTGKGQTELQRWLQHPTRPEGFRSELLLKLFLGAHAPAEANVRQIQEFKQRQHALLSTYAGIEQRLRAEARDHPDLPYWLLTLRYGRRRATALARWSEEALTTLQRLRRPPRRRKPAR